MGCSLQVWDSHNHTMQTPKCCNVCCIPALSLQVWDLRNQRCLQTLQDCTTHSPEDTLSALAYSPSRKLLVSAAYSLRAWPVTDGAAGGCGHMDPISWVGYNPMFCEVR
jgi:WD40 repeat protein